ncbi:hypothetical protein [Halorussus lipolyticus]|uniref:hypothetical protein n=1 Tax=Halorussus lipolyticus TaxID=3034024 RepID=UPI0023E7C0DA|nr:hypothetical protein [Halorussus sp. DT80]
MTGVLYRALGVFVRLFGVGVAVFGAFVATKSPETGFPVLLFGASFALRPHLVGKAVDWVRILIY